MLRFVDKVIEFLFPVMAMHHDYLRGAQIAGNTQSTVISSTQGWSGWKPKKPVIWFNGFPGSPKLPLVQRPRPAASSSNPVASVEPKEEEGEEEVEDPEPVCRKQY